MKLKSIKYFNNEQEWGFDKIEFFDLTLLVGVSGVGKTQVLRSIHALQKIAQGSNENGVKWEVEFETLKGNIYNWKGEFENLKSKNEFIPDFLNSDKEEIEPKIVFEELLLNSEKIIERNQESFIFNGKEMPKLISTESAINILKEEELILDLSESLKLIIYRDHTQKEGVRYSRLSIKKLKNKYKNFQQIKESELETFDKLALVYEMQEPVFDEIKSRFVEVFPQVEDVKIEPIQDDEFSNFLFEATIIQIKEVGVQKWIPHNRMSSGMLRTLIHIAEMYLWVEGTVILIDEFENSLGLNCIDVLTEDLVYDDNNIQFIATSHHPYIINKIPFDYWKIVTRKGGLIKTFDAKDFDMGKSHHDRFMSLINHPFYKQGIS
ncbi:AAA family ATPase [Leeuwenhoekiella sp. LLG6367-2.1]|uniref:AAA family ATPase n=1 Tax=Leeuwenhoekiella sp. LLG6367-2.1 TaxID=3160833 RepID=UPI00386A8806